MQDIVFYAIANETLGIVRDYANARNQTAPVLVLGVSVCLRIRLFAASDTATPYPISAFSGIATWQWNMDADCDRSTTCKLTADAGSITVQSVTDTVNGETLNFTEVAIPISNTNTQELTAWLGNEKKRSGLNGELVGYDNTGNAVFVLQIENFTVRNRVAGLGDPTALDQGIVTRSIAEEMIQAAVSSATESKQDKLNSTNAGTGISINSSGVISTSNVPQSAVTGLSASLAAKQDTLSAGYRMEIISGSTVAQSRFFNIETPSGSTITLMAGHTYKILATTSAKTLIAESFGTSQFGLDGHAEIFVANSGYIHTGTNVILANALEPDAVNNCTVRFHDGLAIISVEDHVAGYIVVSVSGSSAGTLPYALSSASQEYVAFDASLNGQTFDLGGAVTSAGEKHVVGNGYADTILTGGVSCTSKTTFANLAMSGVVNSGGTMTLGDVYIPNGATVSVNGGGLVIEKVTGNGGVVNLNSTNVLVSSGATAYANGCTFSGGSATFGGALLVSGTNANMFASNCRFENNTGITGGVAHITDVSASADFFNCEFTSNTGSPVLNGFRSHVTLTGCTFSENSSRTLEQSYSDGKITISNCIFGSNQKIGMASYISAGSATFELAGSNTIDSISGGCIVAVTSGAIVDLTGNTNATPINPSGGITFAPGGATVYPSAGSAGAYTLGGMTVPSVGNTNVVNLNGSQVAIGSNATANASGCTFTGGYTAYGGAFVASRGGKMILNDCLVSGNNVPNGYGKAIYLFNGGSAVLTNCNVYGNNASYGNGDIVVRQESELTINGGTYGIIGIISGGTVTVGGNNAIDFLYGISTSSTYVRISSGASINLTSSISAAEVTVLEGGCVVNGNAIAAGTYTSIDSTGTPT